MGEVGDKGADGGWSCTVIATESWVFASWGGVMALYDLPRLLPSSSGVDGLASYIPSA